uniref:ABC transporter domain-containing protein n=1 Tax=Heterosigma akashiwo TaxID=2829 RepID=A0A7S4DCY3_HETAK
MAPVPDFSEQYSPLLLTPTTNSCEGEEGFSKQPTTPEKRLAKITIKRGVGIDQIKFTYTNRKDWSAGHDEGKEDPRIAVMTQGEFLVKVTHERLINNASAGAAVEFETNKGRVFAYNPRALATKRESERTTLVAKPGHEIIALTIRNGQMVGIQEQKVPSGEDVEHAPSWFTVMAFAADDDKHQDLEAELLTKEWHFNSKSEAMKKWRFIQGKVKAGGTSVSSMKKEDDLNLTTSECGAAAVLLDTKKMRVERQAGPEEQLQTLLQRAQETGYYLSHADEDGVSLLRTLTMLVKVLNDPSDVSNFVLVVAFLVVSFYMDLSASMLTGLVLTSVTDSSASVTADTTNNWAVSKVCRYAVTCEAGDAPSYRQAVILAFLIVKVLESFFYVLNVWVHHRACAKKDLALKLKSFNHVLSLDQAFFDTKTTTEIRGAMNADALNNLITWNIPYLVTLSLKLVMVFYFLFSINVRLAAITLVAMLMIKLGVLDTLGHYEQVFHKLMQKIRIDRDQIEAETFSTMATVKLFSKEWYHAERFSESTNRLMDTTNTEVLYRCVREFLYGAAKTATFCLVLLQSAAALQGPGGPSAAGLTSFFLMFQEVLNLIGRIKWHYDLLNREFSDIERFLELMKREPAIRPGGAKPPGVQGEVEFRGVHFAYPARPGERVLKGLDLLLAPNKVTAVVGESGAGKSTLAKLLLRLYDPQEGAVLLDGVPLGDYDPNHLHDHVAIVSQNPELRNASLYDNIAYGAPGRAPPPRAKVLAAARLARCHGFISKFAAGYDTFAGAGGAQLSGGQRQRVSIARAALRDPRVLVLDEATSALDAENEEEVQRALEGLMAGRTTVVIAHRLSTIKNADEVVCMRGGAVEERGTHAELMARRGAYFRLVSKQMMGVPAETPAQA